MHYYCAWYRKRYLAEGPRKQTETIFPKFATKLYRQYEQDVNEYLDENNPRTSIPAPTLSSTPNVNNDMRTSMSAQRTSENLLKSVAGSQGELKGQMASLIEMVICLQEEVNELKDNLNSRNKETARNQTITVDLSNTNNEEQNQDVTLNDSQDQEESVVSRTSSYSEAVQTDPLPERNLQSTPDLNEQRSRNNVGQSTHRNSVTNNENKKTLLVGDSLLSGVNGKGLKNNVHCQPVPGATIIQIKEKITMYDLSQFQNIIIYCGGNDSAKSDNTDSFKKAYEQLLQYIRSKNPDCKLYLCGSCPRGDADTTGFNTVIKILAQHQGHEFVNAYDAFYDNSNELRTEFYGVRDWIHLSSSGIRRLLGTIHQAIPIVEDFRYCAYPQEQMNSPKHSNQNTRSQKNHHRQQHQMNTQTSGNRQSSYRMSQNRPTSQTTQQPSGDVQSYYGSSYNQTRGRQISSYSNGDSDYREQTRNSDTGYQSQQWQNPNFGSQRYSQQNDEYSYGHQKIHQGNDVWNADWWIIPPTNVIIRDNFSVMPVTTMGIRIPSAGTNRTAAKKPILFYSKMKLKLTEL